MLKRARWMAVGYGIGVGTTVVAVRRVQRALRAYTPPAIVGRAGERVGGVGRTVRGAVNDGRAAMQEREAQLRARYGAPRPATAADGPDGPRVGH